MRNLKTMLAALGAIFDKKVTTDMLAGYELALAEYNETDLVRVGRKLAQGKFFPRPYDFIQAIEGDKPKPEDLASLRWEQILGWLWKDEPFPDDQVAEKIFYSMGDRFYFRQMTDQGLRGAGFAFRRSYCAALAIEDSNKKERLTGGATPAVIDGVAKMLAMDGEQTNEQ